MCTYLHPYMVNGHNVYIIYTHAYTCTQIGLYAHIHMYTRDYIHKSM